jgi:uncharacterized protein (DUF305 family)
VDLRRATWRDRGLQSRWLLALVTVALIASGCSDANDSEAASGVARHNTADVMFVQGMIPHHQQAVTMSAMAQTRARDPRVVALAAQIGAAQQPEIDDMRTWLDNWDVDESAMNEHLAMGHGTAGMKMQGMLTSDELDALARSNGTEFDTLFLSSMIDHHKGAVVMAKNVKANGWSPAVADLADAIVESQTREIVLMQKWLDA